MDGKEEEISERLAALAALEYEVRLVAGDGLGLDLAFLGNGIIVRELACLSDGRPSPAQLCRRIRAGDSLIAVNGTLLEPLALKDKVAVLIALGGDYKKEVVLRFIGREACSWGRPLIGSYDVYNKNPFASWLEPMEGSLAADEAYEYKMQNEPLSALRRDDDADDGDQQRKWQTVENMVDLGLMRPLSSPKSDSTGVIGPWETAGHLMVQQLINSKLMPWKYKLWEKDEEEDRIDAIRYLTERKWGEFERQHLNLGLVMAPEEMQTELDAIADDLHELWLCKRRASHSRYVSVVRIKFQDSSDISMRLIF